jgi:hypothetical protein
MLQTRAGRCPNCKEETPPGAEACPSCGARLDWEDQSPPYPHAASRPGAGSATPFLRLFALFLFACIATFLAVTFRTKMAGRSNAPALEAGHAVLVQDAETFRDQIKAGVGSTEMPAAAYVIGVAMPSGKDVLEITVKREWEALDYPTRLAYAARFDERWKAIHAPHRASMTILDEAGNEIGGRVWNGRVWVVEASEDTPAPNPGATNAAPGAPPVTGAASPNTAIDQANETPAGNEISTPEAGDAAPGASNSATNSVSSTQTQGNATPTPRDPDDLSDIETQ